MGFIDFFRPSYHLPQGCPGCAARMAHIEDLQNLLKSERAGNATLQSILLQNSRLTVLPSSIADDQKEEMKPLREMHTARALRSQAERREREQFPNARADYWAKVRDQHQAAGKLPDKPEVVEVQKDA
jgi:hypothetical protein